MSEVASLKLLSVPNEYALIKYLFVLYLGRKKGPLE